MSQNNTGSRPLGNISTEGVPVYPYLAIFVGGGQWIAIACAAIVLAIGAWLWQSTANPAFIAGAVVLAGVAYFLIRLVHDLMRVISDILLPR